MNSALSKYLFYYPTTLLNGENVGYYLKSYRASQYWRSEEIAQFHESELKKLLKIARTASFYQGRYDLEGLLNKKGDDFFRSYSQEVPILEKKDLIENKSRMKTTNAGRYSEKTTGGSTGEPVTVLKNSIGLARERAATWRAYEWAGVTIGTKQARFWGVPHNRKNRLKASLIDFVANRMRFSAFDLDSGSLDRIYQNIKKYSPDYLYGYVSAIRELAHFVLENAEKRNDTWSIKCVITTSEVLTQKDREIIERAFKCRVYNEYGCGEVGSIAHECEFGSMHVMAENVYLEQSEEGELIVTDLHNTVMPLIRYRIGDFAQIGYSECSCGVGLPVLTSIGGRAYDIIRTPEGRRIHPESVIYIFEALQQKYSYFKHFQVVQSAGNALTVNLVPTSNWSEKGRSELTQDIKSSLSTNMNVEICIVDSIPREASGKMRVVKFVGNIA
ncbi:phenylacetate--CoA ligase family protein [Saccharospirillum alexandrii]|uniref:phenylacetate--CoA ligase family protein n=1 Tax=Saccharospirillum alexandrii TaxID=2448477 RepID=UPI003734DAE9